MPVITDMFGKSSIDTDYAVATTVKTTRLVGATVLEAFDLSKFAPDTPVFFVTYQKTTDPVTEEVSVVNQVSYKAIVNTGANTLTNLTVAPGYTDLGNAIGDFIECVPTSYWENELIDGILAHANPDGTLKTSAVKTALGGDAVDPVIRAQDMLFDFVASGAVLAGLGYGSTLTASLSAGICYINGNRQTIAAVATHAYTANRDTYVDALYNVSGIATIVYTEVANNAASPALAANSIRLGIIVSGANIAAVGSVNQGQETRVLPIASSVAYSVTDSLGNLICPRDSSRKTLGYRQIITSYGPVATSTTDIDIPGLSVPFIVPTGRKIKATLYADSYTQTGGIGTIYAAFKIKEGASVLVGSSSTPVTANFPVSVNASVNPPLSSGLHTLKASFANNSTGPNCTLVAAAVSPAYIKIEIA